MQAKVYVNKYGGLMAIGWLRTWHRMFIRPNTHSITARHQKMQFLVEQMSVRPVPQYIPLCNFS